MTDPNSFHQRKCLRDCSIAELFEELRVLVAAVPDLRELTLHRFRVSQVELEIQAREMEETVTDLGNMVEEFAGHFYEAPLPYMLLDGRGRVKRANHAAEKLLGSKEQTIKLVPFALLLASSDGAVLRKLLAGIEDDCRCGQRTRHFRLRLGGSVSLLANAQLGAGGQLVGFRVLLGTTSIGRVARRHRRQMRTQSISLLQLNLPADSIFRHLAEVAVRRFACMCLVDRVSKGDDLKRIASAWRPQLEESLVASIQAAGPGGQGGWWTAQQQACHQKEPLLVRRTGPKMAAGAQLATPVSFPKGSLMVVPMLADGQCLGTLTFLRAAGLPAFGQADLCSVTRLAQEAAAMLLGGFNRRSANTTARTHLLSSCVKLQDVIDALLDFGPSAGNEENVELADDDDSHQRQEDLAAVQDVRHALLRTAATDNVPHAVCQALGWPPP